jgi:hypothetical protein
MAQATKMHTITTTDGKAHNFKHEEHKIINDYVLIWQQEEVILEDGKYKLLREKEILRAQIITWETWTYTPTAD